MRSSALKMTVATFVMMIVAGLGTFAVSTQSNAADEAATEAKAACCADGTGACCAAGGACCAEGAKQVAKIGSAAPEFSLKDSAGKEFSLASYKGEKVVALIWADETCPFMKAHFEANTFNKLADQYKDVQFLLIDSNAKTTSESIAGYVKAQSLKAPVLYDPEGKVGHMYEAKTTPHAYVINKEGVLVYEGAIDNAPFGKVNGEGPMVNYVAKTIDALNAGQAIETSQTKPYGCNVKYPS